MELTAKLRDRTTLHLGCGRKHIANALNVDSRAEVNPDLLLDLDARPWPLPDAHFREVFAYDVIEHLDDVIATLEEIHRVCATGALVHITVPHFSCANAFTDPTHKHYFGFESFHYLTGEHQHDHYSRVRFRRRQMQIIFERTIMGRIVGRFARAYPKRYEHRWAWVFPAWFLYAQLEVVKDGFASR